MSRMGVFICWCGANIAETIDCNEVANYAGTLPGVIVSRNYKYMCSDPGQRLITDAITEHNLDAVIVASCSPRMHEPTFRKTAATVGLNPYMLEMANIREHCSWVHPDRRQATEKAKDLVRLLVEKVKRNTPLQAIEIPVTPRVLVIGAGIAGIQAALDIAAAGKEVVLVERKPSIGGFMSMLDETFPTLDCSQCILTPRMVEIMQNDKITLHTYSEVEGVEGYVGNFQVKVRQKARSVDMSKCTGCGECWQNCMAVNKIGAPVKDTSAPCVLPEVASSVDAIIAKYDEPSGMVIGALQDIQACFNYLRRDALQYFSAQTGIPLSRLYGVARFYGAFSLKPRGKHIIRVCLGTACHLKGSGHIMDAITRELGAGNGETTADGLFTLEGVRCLGACALAPVVTIDDTCHANMNIASTMSILRQYADGNIEAEQQTADDGRALPEPAGVI